MITVILTYRNREINILKKCLDSFKKQSNANFKVVLVNYGSSNKFTKALQDIAGDYEFLKIIPCSTQNELWCKSRAVNMAVKACDSSHCFVGDVDMIYHPEFIETLETLKNEPTTYFQVGFLNEEESQKNKAFEDYDINFKSDEGATGMTLFKTDTLKSIQGFDEFYHGWGSEDTDVHTRLKNAGHIINYYDTNVLMLHQWHAKHYRTKDSLEPYHSHLEQINEAYLSFSDMIKKTKANDDNSWGKYSEADYQALASVASDFSITNTQPEVKGFIQSVLARINNTVIHVEIKEHPEYKSVKQLVKGKIGKKTMLFMDMEAVNDLLLESIITNLRGRAYHFEYNRKNQTINLTIKL